MLPMKNLFSCQGMRRARIENPFQRICEGPLQHNAVAAGSSPMLYAPASLDTRLMFCVLRTSWSRRCDADRENEINIDFQRQ